MEIVGFSFSEGLRTLTRKPGVRKETGFLRNFLPVHDIMRSFFGEFATISSLYMTPCDVFLGGGDSLAASGGEKGISCIKYDVLNDSIHLGVPISQELLYKQFRPKKNLIPGT